MAIWKFSFYFFQQSKSKISLCKSADLMFLLSLMAVKDLRYLLLLLRKKSHSSLPSCQKVMN